MSWIGDAVVYVMVSVIIESKFRFPVGWKSVGSVHFPPPDLLVCSYHPVPH